MLKETIKSAKKHPVLWLFVTMLLCGVNYADAQEFNNTGTYSVGGVDNAQGLPATAKRGVIRMKGNATAEGSISGIGQDVNTRIPGTVIWAGKQTNGQHVQPLSYTNLGVQGNGIKKIFGSDNNQNAVAAAPTGDKIYRISNNFLRFGEDIQATPIQRFAVTDVNWNPAAYPNIKHFCDAYVIYDGGHDQAILGSFKASTTGGDNDNEYAYVEKAGTGDAILYTPVRTGTWNNNSDGITQIVNSANNGFGRLDIVAVLCAFYPPTEDDSIIVTPDPPPGGDPDPDDTLPPPVDPPTDPDDPRNVKCQITIGPGIVMNVGQGLYFLDANHAVITDAKSSPLCVTAGVATSTDVFSTNPGKVVYQTGATTIVPARANTDEEWKGYGILQVESDIGVGGEIIVAGPASYALTVVGNSRINTLNDKWAGDGTLTLLSEDYRRITMANPDANIAYTTDADEGIGKPANFNGCGEVMGWIYRTAQADNVWASMIDKDYTFHNSATKLQFGTLPSAAQKDNFGMLMTNSSTPTYYDKVGGDAYADNWDSKAEIPKSDAYGYVDRLWEVDYSGTTGEIKNVNLGFLAAEMHTSFGYIAGQDDWKQTVRGYEAYLGGTANTNTLTTVVGRDGTEPVKWDYDDASASCNYILAKQTNNIILSGAAAPGNGDDARWDMALHSQFVFGNQPLIFTSTRNGRWSDPGLWDKGTTPTSQDNVNIAHIVYTGYYNNATAGASGTAGYFLGARQWPTNEYDLGNVKSVNNFAVLADSVNILAINPTNGTGAEVALIIGSEETGGDKTIENVTVPGTHTPMDFDIPLLFGVITNKAVASNAANWDNLSRAKLPANDIPVGLSGLWITSSGPITDATAKSAIINPNTFNNEGTFVNEAILEVGHDEGG